MPLYFWFGGIAAGSSFVALACDLAGDERVGGGGAQDRARRAGAVAAAADHGPRAAGALLQHAAHLQAALADVDGRVGADRVRQPGRRGGRAPTCSGRRRAARALGAANAVVGGYLGSYTGVLLASTAVPVWARSRLFLGPDLRVHGGRHRRRRLPAHAGRARHAGRTTRRARALGRVETGAMAAELVLSVVNERRLGPLAAGLEVGRPGTLFKAAKWAVRAGLALQARPPARPAQHPASALYLAAGLLFRYAWVRRRPAVGARRPRGGRDGALTPPRPLAAQLERGRAVDHGERGHHGRSGPHLRGR